MIQAPFVFGAAITPVSASTAIVSAMTRMNRARSVMVVAE
jgi:hypothetical protein